jgi:hypothetical protein
MKTNPSGKLLFVCLVCGRISQTPDKECPPSIMMPDWSNGGERPVECCAVERMELAAPLKHHKIDRLLNEAIELAKKNTRAAETKSETHYQQRLDRWLRELQRLRREKARWSD